MNVLLKLIRKFGMEFRSPLIFDRVKEELRTFCANHTIDEVINQCLSLLDYLWRMLKAPPVNPRVYIYRYYNINPTEGSLYVQKYVKKSSK